MILQQQSIEKKTYFQMSSRKASTKRLSYLTRFIGSSLKFEVKKRNLIAAKSFEETNSSYKFLQMRNTSQITLQRVTITYFNCFYVDLRGISNTFTLRNGKIFCRKKKALEKVYKTGTRLNVETSLITYFERFALIQKFHCLS